MRENPGFGRSRPDEMGVAREQDGAEDGSRREVLGKIGRFAYAAPALALLTEPRRAHATYGRGHAPHGGGGGRTKPGRDREDDKDGED